MPGKLKVLVVDDSTFMRKVITDILSSDEEIEVTDTAKNGYEALEKARLLNPDVITLDVEMPVMDGLSCLKELMKTGYIPVVMLSSLTRSGEKATIQALEDGAIDFVTKPVNIFEMTNDSKKLEIIEKVKVASKTHGNRVNRRQRKAFDIQYAVKPDMSKGKEGLPEKSGSVLNIIAVGTSTGGPRSLQDVIPLIPGNVPAAFLITQHMPPGFTRSLAERLDNLSQLTVKEAEDNEIVRAGYAYVAPGDYHLTVDNSEDGTLRIKLTQSPPVRGHRPSVDVMLESLSGTGLKDITVVIMTGMGRDGSEGIMRIKNKNKGYIIAQDEKSCVVYGMPRAAIETGTVDRVVPLKDIAKEITRIVGVQ